MDTHESTQFTVIAFLTVKTPIADAFVAYTLGVFLPCTVTDELAIQNTRVAS